MTTSFDVKDLGLAEMGRNRINWAENCAAGATTQPKSLETSTLIGYALRDRRWRF